MLMVKSIDENKSKNNYSDKNKYLQIENLLEKFYKNNNILKSENDKIFFSMIQIAKCDICHSILESSEDFNSSKYCVNCSRFFHTKCNESDSSLKKKCKLCQYKYI